MGREGSSGDGKRGEGRGGNGRGGDGGGAVHGVPKILKIDPAGIRCTTALHSVCVE